VHGMLIFLPHFEFEAVKYRLGFAMLCHNVLSFSSI